MDLDAEFRKAKIMMLFDKTIESIKQMNKDMETVDLPEFAKMKEDTLEYQTNQYIKKVLKEKRLNDSLLYFL